MGDLDNSCVVGMGGDQKYHLHHLNSLLTRVLTGGGGDGGDVLTENSRGGKHG